MPDAFGFSETIVPSDIPIPEGSKRGFALGVGFYGSGGGAGVIPESD